MKRNLIKYSNSEQ